MGWHEGLWDIYWCSACATCLSKILLLIHLLLITLVPMDKVCLNAETIVISLHYHLLK